MLYGRRLATGTAGAVGFTLVEVMVAVAIFSVIMIAVSMVFLSGTRTCNQSMALAQMRLLEQRAMRDLRVDLEDCRFLDGSNLLDQVNFQRPTPRENALGELRYINTGTHEPFWGDGITEVDGSGETHVQNTLRFQFVAVATLDEAADRVDYNRDGDRTDSFERGRIVRLVLAPDGTTLSQSDVTLDWVFKPVLPRSVPPDLTGPEYDALQVDNAGGPDPLFLLVDDEGAPDPAGGRLQVCLYNMQRVNGMPVLLPLRTVITPVNK